MKSASEWDLNQVLQMPAGEFDWLEFKGRKGLDLTLPGIDENKVLDDLSKQLSAFANSGGGVLVYGILSPHGNGPRSVDDGGVNLAIKSPSTREWLEDVIPNLVEFPLRKFNVYALTNKFGAPGLADDRCIILIDIPNSEEAPHQARDRVYYARVGGKSRPIGHRFVTDIFHRERHARFEVKFGFRSETWLQQPILQGLEKPRPRRSVELIVAATNTGKVYAKYVSLILMMPEFLLPMDERNPGSLLEFNGIKCYVKHLANTRRDVIAVTGPFAVKQYGPSWFDPILPGLCRTWQVDCHSRLLPSELGDQTLRWEMHFDNAVGASGQIALKDIQFDLNDTHDVD
jgi:hypothetical protein